MQRFKKRAVTVHWVLIVVLAISAGLSSGTIVAASAGPSVGLVRPKAERRITQNDHVVMAVEPQTSTVPLGQKFRVRIMIGAGSYQLDGVQAYLDFDPQYLRATEITPGPVWSPTFIFEKSFNNESGQINYAAGLPWGADPLTGTFEVMTVEMEAVELTGGTPLTFSLEKPRKTGVVFEGNSLPLELIDGRVVTRALLHLPLILRS